MVDEKARVEPECGVCKRAAHCSPSGRDHPCACPECRDRKPDVAAIPPTDAPAPTVPPADDATTVAREKGVYA